MWPAASADDQSCLAAAHQAAVDLVDGSLRVVNDCLAGDSCDAAAVSDERSALASTARGEIEAACDDLSELIALTPGTFVERAAGQVDCLTATGHADTGALELRCGPSYAQFDAPRGEWTPLATMMCCVSGSIPALTNSWRLVLPKGRLLSNSVWSSVVTTTARWPAS